MSAVQCMDAEIERIATAMKLASLWDDTLFVFAADNGGPPCKPHRRPLRSLSLRSVSVALRARSFKDTCAELLALCPPDVANSNYPMRGGKWTIWCVEQRSVIRNSPHALHQSTRALEVSELSCFTIPSSPLSMLLGCWAAGLPAGRVVPT